MELIAPAKDFIFETLIDMPKRVVVSTILIIGDAILDQFSGILMSPSTCGPMTNASAPPISPDGRYSLRSGLTTERKATPASKKRNRYINSFTAVVNIALPPIF